MITVEDIIDINEGLLERTDTVLSKSGIGSALSSYPYYDTKQEQVCSILRGIVKNHPFQDANKRTASLTFIKICKDWGLSIPSDTDLIEYTVKIAESKMEVTKIAKMIFGDYKKQSSQKTLMIKQASKLISETKIDDYRIKQAKKLIAQLDKKADWYYDVSQHALCQNIIRLLENYSWNANIRQALKLFLEVVKHEIIA